MIALRGAHPALSSGDYTPVDAGTRAVYSFVRRSADETLLVIINLSASPVSDYSLKLPDAYSAAKAALVAGTGTLAQPSGGGYVPLASLPPYSLTVIQFAH